MTVYVYPSGVDIPALTMSSNSNSQYQQQTHKATANVAKRILKPAQAGNAAAQAAQKIVDPEIGTGSMIVPLTLRNECEELSLNKIKAIEQDLKNVSDNSGVFNSNYVGPRVHALLMWTHRMYSPLAFEMQALSSPLLSPAGIQAAYSMMLSSQSIQIK